MNPDQNLNEGHVQPLSFAGRRVLSARLEKVGNVTDVVFHDREQTPRWAIVKSGLIGGEHFVPLADSYLDDDGQLVVAFDKTTIKRAPRARRGHVLTLQTTKELREYYGIAA